LDFKEFSYGRAPSFARALCRFDAISLSLNKEMAKENRFRQAEIASLLVS
jgi:hypothetical protein